MNRVLKYIITHIIFPEIPHLPKYYEVLMNFLGLKRNSPPPITNIILNVLLIDPNAFTWRDRVNIWRIFLIGSSNKRLFSLPNNNDYHNFLLNYFIFDLCKRSNSLKNSIRLIKETEKLKRNYTKNNIYGGSPALYRFVFIHFSR